jgi:hypothetical protein
MPDIVCIALQSLCSFRPRSAGGTTSGGNADAAVEKTEEVRVHVYMYVCVYMYVTYVSYLMTRYVGAAHQAATGAAKRFPHVFLLQRTRPRSPCSTNVICVFLCRALLPGRWVKGRSSREQEWFNVMILFYEPASQVWNGRGWDAALQVSTSTFFRSRLPVFQMYFFLFLRMNALFFSGASDHPQKTALQVTCICQRAMHCIFPHTLFSSQRQSKAMVD